jgi:hypothetical protein
LRRADSRFRRNRKLAASSENILSRVLILLTKLYHRI